MEEIFFYTHYSYSPNPPFEDLRGEGDVKNTGKWRFRWWRFLRHTCKIIYLLPGGQTVRLLDLEKGDAYTMELPFNIDTINPLSEHQYLVVVQQDTHNQNQVTL